MEHVYSKRFQGKVNVLGYIVDGVPFLKLFDAIGKYSAVSEALNHLRGRSMELYSISRLTITEGVLP